MKNLSIFALISETAKRPGAMCGRITAALIWCAIVFFCCAVINAAGMSPINPGTTGTTVNSHIAHGDLVYHITSPGVSCDHAPVTAFGNIYKTPSNISGKYNVVVPKDHMLAALHADFTDNDFFVSDQNEYTVWEDNDSTYSVTASGFPAAVNISGVTAENVGSFGISGNFSGVAVGKYPSSFTITDNGSPTHTNVTDSPAAFDFDLWVIDLAEKTGTISVDQDDVYEIDLTAVPGDFPHENECEISVSWGGLLPFFNVPSGLYLDAACQDQISADAGTICTKTWTYGASETPEKLYYKRPSNNIQDLYYIRLKVNNTTFLQSELTFTNMATAFLARADAPAAAVIKGYWTHGLTEYPSCEWHDDDGTNSDVIGYTGNDKDRPFVFSQGSNFRLDTAAFKPYSAGTLSGSWSVSSNKHSFSSSGTLPAADNEGKYNVSFSGVNGSALGVINSETVTLDWSAAGESFRTKHKVYTIGGTLNDNNKYHTLIEIGCEAAKGLSNTQKDMIVEREYNKIKTLHINRIDGQGLLEYWGEKTISNESQHNTLEELLDTCDGDCIAWADLLKQLLSLQGIQSTVCTISFSYNTVVGGMMCKGFLQNEQNLQGEITSTLFARKKFFNIHKIVKYVNENGQSLYYDPGTGKGPFPSWQYYIASELTFCFPSGNDDVNYIPCCLFIDPYQYFSYTE